MLARVLTVGAGVGFSSGAVMNFGSGSGADADSVGIRFDFW